MPQWLSNWSNKQAEAETETETETRNAHARTQARISQHGFVKNKCDASIPPVI